jgi:hypothetical protein
MLECALIAFLFIVDVQCAISRSNHFFKIYQVILRFLISKDCVSVIHVVKVIVWHKLGGKSLTVNSVRIFGATHLKRMIKVN